MQVQCGEEEEPKFHRKQQSTMNQKKLKTKLDMSETSYVKISDVNTETREKQRKTIKHNNTSTTFSLFIFHSAETTNSQQVGARLSNRLVVSQMFSQTSTGAAALHSCVVRSSRRGNHRARREPQGYQQTWHHITFLTFYIQQNQDGSVCCYLQCQHLTISSAPKSGPAESRVSVQEQQNSDFVSKSKKQTRETFQNVCLSLWDDVGQVLAHELWIRTSAEDSEVIKISSSI